VSFYHQGSADLIDDAIRHKGVDVFLAGIAGRSVTPRYWERILPRLDPKVVVPTHYDDFFEPLDAPLQTMNCDVAGLPGELARVSRDVTIAALPRVLGDDGPTAAAR